MLARRRRSCCLFASWTSASPPPAALIDYNYTDQRRRVRGARLVHRTVYYDGNLSAKLSGSLPRSSARSSTGRGGDAADCGLARKARHGQYAQRFAENDIDFAILGELTDQDLEKIGVASLGHRRKLLRAIVNLGAWSKAHLRSRACSVCNAASGGIRRAPPSHGYVL